MANDEASRNAHHKADEEAKRVAQQKADEDAKRIAQQRLDQEKAEQMAKDEQARREEQARQLRMQKAELDQKTAALKRKIGEQDAIIGRLERTIAEMQQRPPTGASVDAAKERETQLELARTELLLAQRERQRAIVDVDALTRGMGPTDRTGIDDEIQKLELRIARLRGGLEQLQSQREEATKQQTRRSSNLPVITP
jgi:hypothetical protein